MARLDYYEPYMFGIDYQEPSVYGGHTYDPYAGHADPLAPPTRELPQADPGTVEDRANQGGVVGETAPGPFAGDYEATITRIFNEGRAAGLPVPQILANMAAAVGGEVWGDDSIKLPDGSIFDALLSGSDEGGSARPMWSQTHGPGGVDLRKATLPAGFAVGDFLKPWTDTFTPPPDAATRYPTLPDLSLPEVPDLPEFAPPTADSMFADPGYQFRRRQGEDALLNNRAAQGLLRTGGTVKDFLDYNQNFASQEYGNIFDRALTTHQLNRDNILDSYGLGVTRASAMYEPNVIRYGAEFPAAQYDASTAWNRAWQEFQDRKSTFYEGQDRPYEKLRWQTELGFDAARS